MCQSHLAVSHAARQEAMCSRRALRSNPPFWSAAPPLVLRAGVVWLALIASDAMVGTREAVDPKAELVYELGVQKMAQSMCVYQNIAQYKAQFSGADLSRFAFNEVSRVASRATSPRPAASIRTPRQQENAHDHTDSQWRTARR